MSEAKPTTMSRVEYARHRGCSPAMVTKLGKTGRLVLTDDGMVDVAASDALIAKVSDALRGGKNGQSTAQKNRDVANETAEATGTAQIAHKRVQTKMAELEYRKRLGELCEVARVEKGNENAFGAARQALEQLPAKLASRIAAENDVRRCHTMIDREVSAILSALADALALLAGSRAATQQ